MSSHHYAEEIESISRRREFRRLAWNVFYFCLGIALGTLWAMSKL